MRKSAFIMMVLAAIVQSCIYPYTPDVPESSDSMLVIDGDITVGEKCSFSARMILPLDYEGDTGLTFVDEAVFTVEHDSGV